MVSKKENTDITIPQIPNILIGILLDKNILNTTAINLKTKDENVKINPFFIKTLKFFIVSSI